MQDIFRISARKSSPPVACDITRPVICLVLHYLQTVSLLILVSFVNDLVIWNYLGKAAAENVKGFFVLLLCFIYCEYGASPDMLQIQYCLLA